jgi:hypothetical protein
VDDSSDEKFNNAFVNREKRISTIDSNKELESVLDDTNLGTEYKAMCKKLYTLDRKHFEMFEFNRGNFTDNQRKELENAIGKLLQKMTNHYQTYGYQNKTTH